MFVVGGDDLYDVPGANEIYIEAADLLRAECPRSLLTTHIAPKAVLPDAIAERLDFYLHQTGHDIECQELPWTQPGDYLRRLRGSRSSSRSRPTSSTASWGVMADGAARTFAGPVGRAGCREHRRASATAPTASGCGRRPEAPSPPPPRRCRRSPGAETLTLPGALDVSLMGYLMRQHAMHRLEPAQELLEPMADPAFRLAADPDRAIVALYLPYPLAVGIRIDLGGYRVSAWDLHERAPLVVDVTTEAGVTRLGQLYSASDQLVIAERTV